MNIGAKYLLDTNILIELMLGRERWTDNVKKWVENGEIAINSIVVAEFLSKASQLEREKLKLLTSRFGVISIDEVIGEVAGNYRQQFLNRKNKVYLLDCIMAATAKVCNLILVTRNTTDFPMKDIEIMDPEKI